MELDKLLVAIVKAMGGGLYLRTEDLQIEPHESVFIEQAEHGYLLTYKNQMLIDGEQNF